MHRASASGGMPHICNRSSAGQGVEEEARRCMLSRTTDLGRRCRCSFWSRMSCDLCLPLTRRQQRQGPVARTPFCVCTANARHNERNKNEQLRNKTHLDCITWPLPQMTPARRWVLGLVPTGRHIVMPQIWHLPSPLTSGDAVVAHSGAECHATFVFHLLGVSSDKVLWRGPPFVFARQTQDTTKETKMNN